eukprot:5367148-Heterocapsa_arctica.AAC.1
MQPGPGFLPHRRAVRRPPTADALPKLVGARVVEGAVLGQVVPGAELDQAVARCFVRPWHALKRSRVQAGELDDLLQRVAGVA